MRLWQSVQSQEEQDTKLTNPFRLWPAIQFGLIFGAVLLITRGAQAFLGDTGVYVTSFLTGLTGLDVVTLSMAQLAGSGVSYGVAAQALLLAVTANLGYFIGDKGGRPLLQRFFKPEKVALVQNYYRRYDVWAVGMAGFTPIPYKLFSISAGAFGLDLKRFVVVSMIGRGGRFLLVGLDGQAP